MDEEGLSPVLSNEMVKIESEPYIDEVQAVKNEPDDIEDLDVPDFVHIENSEMDSLFECTKCPSLYFAEKPQLELHSEIHEYADDAKNMLCPVCSRTFTTHKSFKTHIQDQHVNQFARCPFCPEYFFGAKTLTCHIAHHKKTEKLFTCNFCGKKFHTTKERNVHERVHTNERPYECSICKKAFKQPGSLRVHVDIIHNKSKTSVQCEQCDGFFSTLSSLTRHRKKIHDKGKTYPCKICNMIFQSKDTYLKHHSEIHVEQRYSKLCLSCKKTFYSRSAYRHHRMKNPECDKIHKINLNPSRNRSGRKRADQDKADDANPKGSPVTNNKNDLKDKKRKPSSNFKRPTAKRKSKEDSDSEPLNSEISIKKAAIKEEKDVYNNEYLNKKMKAEDEMVSNDIEIESGDLKTEQHCDSNIKNLQVECSKCCEILPNQSLYDLHVTTHTFDGTQIIVCPCCFKKFTKPHSYTQHIKSHIKILAKHSLKNPLDDESLTVMCETTCPKCHEIFPNQALCNLHSSIHSIDSSTGAICPVCCKKFVTLRYYSEHIDRHIKESLLKMENIKQEPLTSSFECLECHEKFTHQELLDIHATIHKSEAIWQCPICQKKYIVLRHYTDHIRCHLNDCMTCKHCGKVMYRKSDLTKHIKEHISDAPFKCRTCAQSFEKRYQRDMHERQIHLVENGKLIRCHKCLLKFSDVGEYQAHRLTCTEYNKKFYKKRSHSLSNKKLECTKCNIEFKDQNECKRHFLENHLNKSVSSGPSEVDSSGSEDGTNEEFNLDTSEDDSDMSQQTSSLEKSCQSPVLNVINDSESTLECISVKIENDV